MSRQTVGPARADPADDPDDTEDAPAAAAAGCQHAVGCECARSFDLATCLTVVPGVRMEFDGLEGGCILVNASIESLSVQGNGTSVLVNGFGEQVTIRKFLRMMPGTGNLCMVGEYHVGEEIAVGEGSGTTTLCGGSPRVALAAAPTTVRVARSQTVFIDATRNSLGNVTVNGGEAPVCIFDGLSPSSAVEIRGLNGSEVRLNAPEGDAMPIQSLRLTELSDVPVHLGNLALDGDLRITDARLSDEQGSEAEASITILDVWARGGATIAGIDGALQLTGCPAPGMGSLSIGQARDITISECSHLGNAVVRDAGAVTISAGTAVGKTTIHRAGDVKIHGLDGKLEDLLIDSVDSLSISDCVDLHPQVFEVRGSVDVQETSFGHLFLDNVEGAVTVAGCGFEVLFVSRGKSTVSIADNIVNKDLVVEKVKGDVVMSNNVAESGRGGFTLQAQGNEDTTTVRGNNFKAYFLNENKEVVFEGNSGILFECDLGDALANRICGDYGTLHTEGTCFPIGHCLAASS